MVQSMLIIKVFIICFTITKEVRILLNSIIFWGTMLWLSTDYMLFYHKTENSSNPTRMLLIEQNIITIDNVKLYIRWNILTFTPVILSFGQSADISHVSKVIWPKLKVVCYSVPDIFSLTLQKKAVRISMCISLMVPSFSLSRNTVKITYVQLKHKHFCLGFLI
jgi:hypothetical protein